MLQQLKQMGINPSAIYCNLSQEEWREQELERGEGRLSENGTVIVKVKGVDLQEISDKIVSVGFVVE